MQNLRAESAVVHGSAAIFRATGDRYRVTLTMERKDGKNISEIEARRVYTQALAVFPQVTSIGRVPD